MKSTPLKGSITQNTWRIAKYILAVGMVVFVIAKTDLNQIISLWDRLSWHWLLLSFLAFFLMTLLKALQYHILLGPKVLFPNVLKVVIWQNAISNFVATSAGIASYMTMLKAEQKIKLSRSGITFLVTKFGDLLAISLYLGLSTILVWEQIGLLQWLTIFLIVGMLLGLAAFTITILWRERFVTLVARVLTWLRLDHFSLVKRGLGMLRSLADEEQSSIFAMLRTGVVLSLVYMTATMVFVYTRIQIFDVQLGLWPVIYIASLMQMVSFVPIQVFGGLGVSEVTSVYLFSVFGLDQGEMAAIMLGLRALSYLMNASILLYLPFDALIRRYNKKYENK